MPTPTPRAEEIEQVHTAIMTETYSHALALVAGLTDEQWRATLDDLDAFSAVKRKHSNLNGQIAGYVTDNAGLRLAIRNDIRIRLGLPVLASEQSAASSNFDISSTLQWW